MPPPPPPQPPSFSLPASNSKDQGQSINVLLQSIRSGKTLKKTVTVDKSGPAISGKVVGDSSHSTVSHTSGNNTSSSLNNNVGSNFNNGNPPTLGGLFSGGMPKLKPTGLRANMAEKESNNTNNSSNNTPSNVIPSIKRGPPPLPPPAAQKPQLFSQATNSPESGTSNSESPRGFGKLNLAPKPPPPPLSTVPRKPSPPPKKISLAVGNTVSRAQSMRLARSSPTLASPLSSLHQSQDRLNETMQYRTLGRVPLKPPVVRPPSPPKHQSATGNSNAGSTTSLTTSTRVAPPPPSRVTAPSIPPPPPPLPSRAAPSQPRSTPAPHLPPTPPTRNTLARNGQLSHPPIDLEVRFTDLFHSIAHFPPPEPFRRVPKVYNSKNAAKQQAPPPPPLRTTSDAGAMH